MKRIVTFGVFDYFHLGHLRLFKQCKQYGDYLIVFVQRQEYVNRYKKDANVLYTTKERIEILQSIREVDEVIPYNTVCIDELSKIEFDVLALGEDHVGERFDLLINYCNERKKQVVRLKRTEGISSTSIKSKIEELS